MMDLPNSMMRAKARRWRGFGELQDWKDEGGPRAELE
jgi:hypothetical protein